MKCIDCFCAGLTNNYDTLDFIYGNKVSKETNSTVGIYLKDRNKYALNFGGNNIKNKIIANHILNSVHFNKTYVDTVYFPGTRNIFFIETIDKCRKTGLYREYFENGNLKSVGNYLNDDENGEWKYYGTDGSLNNVILYKKGEVIASTMH